MRVYFNLLDPTHNIPDPTGVEVADVEQARVEAEQVIAELAEKEPLAQNVKGWRLVAVDTAGALLFSLNLDRTVH